MTYSLEMADMLENGLNSLGLNSLVVLRIDVSG